MKNNRVKNYIKKKYQNNIKSLVKDNKIVYIVIIIIDNFFNKNFFKFFFIYLHFFNLIL